MFQLQCFIAARRPVVVLAAFIFTLFASCTKPQPEKPTGEEEQAPVITSFTPQQGPVGTTVTITGQHFGNNTNSLVVTFNNVPVTFLSINGNTIVTTVPEAATTGKIKIARGDKEHMSTATFSVVPASGQPGEPPAGWSLSHFAGSGATGNADGPAGSATFRTPKGMAMDAAGNLYVADAAANRIRKITPAGAVSTIAGTGARGMNNGNALTEATFNNPLNVAIDMNGNILVADGSNHAIRKITPAGVVSTVAGTGTYGYRDGPAASAQFSTPYGIAVDDVGNIYVGDHANHRIRKITPGKVVTTIAGNGSSNSSDGMDTEAGISWPGGIVLDEAYNIYVAERGGGRIRKIALTGQVSTIGGYLSVNNHPSHMALDSDGNLYVLYRSLHRIKKYSPAGVETDVIGTGDPGNENGKTGRMRHPEGLVLVQNAAGSIHFFVADTDNKMIRKIIWQ